MLQHAQLTGRAVSVQAERPEVELAAVHQGLPLEKLLFLSIKFHLYMLGQQFAKIHTGKKLPKWELGLQLS